MIYLTLGGGLGNQMFQYAVSYEISKKTNQNIICNLYHIRQDAIRDMSLQALSIPDIKICNPAQEYTAKMLIKLARKVGSFQKEEYKWMRSHGFYIEYPEYQYIPLKDTRNHRNYFVEGAFQTYKYFIQDRDEILSLMRVSKKIEKSNEDIWMEILKENSVCVHIRRGDYLKYKYLNICNYEYYKRGMDYICGQTANPIFYIFSPSHEDIEWIKNNYDFSDYTVKYIDCGNADYEELRLMYSCRHFIISNSTFSWWAQFLGTAENKLVVAPDMWNTQAGKEQYNLYLDSWHIIPLENKQENYAK